MNNSATYIVGFHRQCSHSECLRIHKQIGAKLVGRIKELHAHIVTVPKSKNFACKSHYSTCRQVTFVQRSVAYKVPEAGRARLAAKPAAKPAAKLAAKLSQTDPLLSKQWGLSKVHAHQAWLRSRSSPPTIPIAILDTGIDQDHPDVSGRIMLQANFSSSPTWDDLYGHGTHVAGIAAAVTGNGYGIAGMSCNAALLMNIKVLGDDGSGTSIGVANGVIFAVKNGAKVINMSLAGGARDPLLERAIRFAVSKGVIVIAAAGNENTSQPQYPAAYQGVIGVGATDSKDKRASFSNYGGSWVDVAAPGVNIVSTLPNHANKMGRHFGYMSGTSMAAPFVSGLAALLWTIRASGAVVRRSLLSTADRVTGAGEWCRYGRIHAARAAALLFNQAQKSK